MPRATTTSAIFGKYGTKLISAHNNHVNDVTELGFVDLPAGIENGIAKLVDCRFGQFKEGDNKGEWYFMARGSVVEPAVHGKMPIVDLFTQIGPEPLCDTPSRTRKTTDEHIKWIYDEMDKLGMKREDIDPENLEAAAQALKEAGPYFRFRTWKGEKQTTGQYANREPRVHHQWQGQVEYEASEDPAAGFDEGQDDAPPAPAPRQTAQGRPSARPTTTPNGSNGQATRTPRAPARTPAPPPQPAAPAGDFRDDADLDSLAERANDNDADAALELMEFAVKAGYTEDEVNGAASWVDVVEMINNPRSAEDSEGDTGDDQEDESGDGDETVTPQKGDHWKYRLAGVGGNPGKEVTVEVVKVYEDKGTCDVKNLKDNKVIKGVAFSDLIGSE